MQGPRSDDRLDFRHRRWLLAAYSSLVFFALLAAAASFLPDKRLWGVNHLAFYPVWVRIAALAVMALACTPRAGGIVSRIFDRLASAFSGRRRLLWAFVVSIAALVLFIVFTSATELLGDGLYTANNIERAAKVDREVFVKVLKNPDPIYPGTETLNLALSRTALTTLGVPPLRSVRVMNALLGAILVFVIVAGAQRSGSTTPGNDVSLVTLAFLSGGIQIFFGYIEAYAPLLFFTGLYVWAAHRTLARGARVWGPAVFAAAATAMHLLALLLLPSLVLLVLWVSLGRRLSNRFLAWAGILGAATAALPFLAVDVLGLERFFLPLTGDAYAVLSLPHLADVANEMLLLFPGGVVLGVVAAMTLMERFRGPEQAPGTGRGSGPESDPANDAVVRALHRSASENPAFLPRLFFAVLLAIPSALFLFFFKPELGVARDWDLFAITGVGPLMLVATVLGSVDADSPAGGMTRRFLPPVLAMTAVLTASWVGINADPRRAAARFESILTYDKARAGYAYESLASLYKDRGDVAAGIRALEKAVEVSPNPRYLFALGLGYYEVGEKEKAVATLDRCLRMRPKHDRARQSLVQMLFAMERYEELVRVCEEGARLDPKLGHYPFFMGKAFAKLGRGADARGAFDMCRSLDPPPEVAREIDQILRSLDENPDRPGERDANNNGRPQ